HSDAFGSRSHTGRPSAPARWATEVSTLITRSRSETATEVSAKSESQGERSAIFTPSSSDMSPDRSPTWRLNQLMPRTSHNGCNSRRSIAPTVVPAQTIPTLRPDALEICSVQAVGASPGALRYGTALGI